MAVEGEVLDQPEACPARRQDRLPQRLIRQAGHCPQHVLALIALIALIASSASRSATAVNGPVQGPRCRLESRPV